MGTTADLANEAFRDFVTDGVPASGANNPVKADIRAVFADADTRLNATVTSMGELYNKTTVIGQALGGSSLITLNNKIVGISIPSGQTGNSAFITAYLPLTPQQLARFAGKTISLIATFAATSGFATAAPLSTSIFAFVTVGGVESNVGSLVSSKQTGTTIRREVSYTVVGNETKIAMPIQIVNSAPLAGTGTIQLVSITCEVTSDPTAIGPSGATGQAAIRYRAAERFAMGSLLSDFQGAPVLFNATVALNDSNGNPVGLKVPAGNFAGASFIQYYYTFDNYELSVFPGRLIRVFLGINTNVNYPRILLPSIGAVVGGVGVTITDTVIRRNDQGGTRRLIEMVGTVPANATRLFASVAFGTPDAITSEDDTFTLSDIDIEVLETTSDLLTPSEETIRLRSNRDNRIALAAATKGLTAQIGTQHSQYSTRYVIPADFASITAAIAQIATNNDAAPSKRYEIYLPDGTYTDVDWQAPDYTDIRGQSRGGTHFDVLQAASTSLTNITNTSAVDSIKNSIFTNLSFRIQNGRYALHSDALGLAQNVVLRIVDCRFEHLGNDAAVAYQTGLGGGGNPGGVWAATGAMGFGFSDGSETYIRGSTFIGYKFGGLVGHNSQGGTAPIVLDVEDCIIDSQIDSQTCFNFSVIGSRQSDRIRMVGNDFAQAIGAYIGPWLNANAADQVANKLNLIWTGHSNRSVAFVLVNDATAALRIDSATTGISSAIALSGSAVAAIFGSVVTVAGDVGLAGGAYGTWDVGDHVVGPSLNLNITQLGYRLGDCSVTNKTLVVTYDGGASITITFNTDLRAVSNTTILASINSALGAHATASLFVVNDLFRPHFTDEEIRIKNTDTTTILRKTAVKFDTSTSTGKVMTSTDAAVLFAGIAYEDIRPGQTGRVKSRGVVRVSQDMLRSDGSGSFVLGATFGVGATAGKFVASPSIPLLSAVNTNDVGFIKRTYDGL